MEIRSEFLNNQNAFHIRLSSVRDVEEFVTISTTKPFPVYLDDGKHRVNGKSFMEMFCLVLSHPLRVTADCSDDAFQELRSQTARFLVY